MHKKYSRSFIKLWFNPSGGAEGMKEPDGARWMKGRGAARGVESWGAEWSTPDQGGAGGTREPSGVSVQMGHGGEEGARSHSGAGGSTGRGGVHVEEAGGGVEGNSDHSDAGEWSHRIDVGLRVSRGAARRQRWKRQEQVGGRSYVCLWDSSAELMEWELTLEGALEAWALYAKFKLTNNKKTKLSSDELYLSHTQLYRV